MIRTTAILFAAMALAAASVRAQDILINGTLDQPLTVPGWRLIETVTGMPGAEIDSAQFQQGFANQPLPAPGESGLWLLSFAGQINDYAGQNRMINAVLSQIVPGTAGETYTFSGWSRWEQNYSGGVTMLSPSSPSGEILSPTESAFELAFLDGSNAVIGSPVSLHLRTVQTNDHVWRHHVLPATLAPAGTASVSVTASATDMVFNERQMQTAMYDNFSLTTDSAPAIELLINSQLNDPPAIPGGTLSESPADTATYQQNFADRPPGPGFGLWLRGFATELPEGDVVFSQTVAGKEYLKYTLSAWSQWEENYSGGLPGSPTQTLLRLEFLDAGNAVIGTEELDLRTEQMNDNTWREHSLVGTAPPSTTSVRVSAIADDMFRTTGEQSAFFDDFMLTFVPEPGGLSLGCFAAAGFYLVRRQCR